MELCESIGIPAGPINTMQGVFADPQVAARGIRVEVDHPTAGRVPLVRSPLWIPTCPPRVFRAPPTLGQHTTDVLVNVLGYAPEYVEAWRKARVV